MSKKALTKYLPNFITSLNLFSGCIAISYLVVSDFHSAFVWVVLAAVFDFLDGFAARVFHAYSHYGKLLDSFADLVSFGVVPGLALYQLINLVTEHMSIYQGDVFVWVAYISFFVPVFSALRLAKFHYDERQTDKFIGFPTPANALLLVSFTALYRGSWGTLPEPVYHPVIIAALAFFTSLLLVSEIQMFSFKKIHQGFKGNVVPFSFIIVAVILFLVFKFIAVPIVIVFYILLSLLTNWKMISF